MSRRSSPGLLGLWLVLCACSFDASGEPTGTSGGGTTAAGSTSDVIGSSSGASAVDDSEGSASVSMGEVDSGPTSLDSGVGESSGGSGSTGAVNGDTSSSGGPAESGGDESSSGGPSAICGNGVIEPGETCETNDLGGAMCSDLGGDFIGEPTCAGCQIDDGPCCLQDGAGCVPFLNDCCTNCGVDFVCG
ncbi:MAG: hypothetical protein JNK45_08900 [Myxococcales bacterium]|nr:hypothetical protein [Myxococcales bacterium]